MTNIYEKEAQSLETAKSFLGPDNTVKMFYGQVIDGPFKSLWFANNKKTIHVQTGTKITTYYGTPLTPTGYVLEWSIEIPVRKERKPKQKMEADPDGFLKQMEKGTYKYLGKKRR